MTTEYDYLFKAFAIRYFDGLVSWPWFKAQAMAESSLNRDAVSPAGAQGLMQLMPGTAAEIAEQLQIANEPFYSPTNIQMGIYYARRMWNVWKEEEELERLRFTFASYNAGLGNILKAQERAKISNQWRSLAKALPYVTGKNAFETIDYVKRIENYRLSLIGS